MLTYKIVRNQQDKDDTKADKYLQTHKVIFIDNVERKIFKNFQPSSDALPLENSNHWGR
jgi:hypothetical protein